MSPRRFIYLLTALLSLALLLLPAVAQAQIGGKSILLVASTKMSDPRFLRTVVLVTRHGRSPPIGVIINRPLDTTLGALLPGLPASEANRPVFFGGPVAPTILAFLFRSETGAADAIAVTDNVHLGRSGPTLSELLRGPRTHQGMRVFVGHAGWSEGQLENEIRLGGWHVMPVDEDMLFDKDVELIWPEMIRRATQQSAELPFSLPLATSKT